MPLHVSKAVTDCLRAGAANCEAVTELEMKKMFRELSIEIRCNQPMPSGALGPRLASSSQTQFGTEGYMVFQADDH